MKILVTGLTGQLGFDVMHEIELRGDHSIKAIGAKRSDFDLTDFDAIQKFFAEHEPNVVIHCAAYTAVDKAEDEKDLAFAVNETGTRNIAEACKLIGAAMIYVSTDYVFPGDGTNFYEVDDATDPQNVYGASKLAGEQAVLETLAKFFIVRVSWVFGINGKNFIKTMLNLSKTHDEIKVVADQIGSPTYTVDLARLLVDMALDKDPKKFGIYHATYEGICSLADLAEEVLRRSGKSTKIIPIATEDYPTKAKRPKNSRLSKKKLDENGFEHLPLWKDAVGRFLNELARQ